MNTEQGMSNVEVLSYPELEIPQYDEVKKIATH
jgi:hypothetical protein